ncbi:MAG TPA: solute carrier family 26 protein, partial [Anaerolineae bacterium]
LLNRYLPVLSWGRAYKREWFSGDLLAGLIVTIMLVPQGMAYALLAGLPPQVGLYASIVPLFLYGLLGTSRVLAVGPVAIVSLLVASGVSEFAEIGTAGYMQLALTLALLVGVIQALMGLFRVGFLVNFLSHPVLAGFTSAAALVIGISQLKHLLGMAMPRLEFFETVLYVVDHIPETNSTTVLIGTTGIAILLYFKLGLSRQLTKLNVPKSVAIPITKSGPLVIVLLGTIVVMAMRLNETAGVKVVGDVPAGLPPITLPALDPTVWQALLPTALAISFVGFMESISVAKSLASKKRQKVNSDQELIALGMANFGAALTGGFPVTGGFSRSVVNYEAGANTGLASIITAVLIAFTVIFLTPLFYFLPQALLAAVIMVAVFGLIDIKTFRHVWKYNKGDVAAMIITFLAVLAISIETGILVGVAVAIAMFIWRTSRPHVAVVGRLGSSEIYRNILRHPVQTCAKAVAIRVDESLYFTNAKYLEDTVLNCIADNPKIEHFILIGTAVNFIDASALETLESLHKELTGAGVTFHLAAIKGPVMDRLVDIGFIKQFGEDHVHLSTHEAMKAIGCMDI